MTHSPGSATKVGDENRRPLLDCVSYRTVYRTGSTCTTCQILAPVGCVFYFVPISGMHVTNRRPVWNKNFLFLCTMSWLLITITGIDEMDSSILHRPCWFSASIFSY